MKKLSAILVVLAYGFACIGIGWAMNTKYGVCIQVSDRIPSIRDIQAMVGAYQDGRIGAETLKLWDRAICEQEARPHFEATK
jgi:hypothetical protein